MRLDKFLKVSRLIKRRTVANEVADQGRTLVNGRVAKPSKDIKEGDKITIKFYNKKVTIEVLQIPTGNVSIQLAKELYSVVEEIPKNK